MDAPKKVDREFNVHRSTAHTVRDANKDIHWLTSSLLENKVTSEDVHQSSPPFTDPTAIGHKKISTTTWVMDTRATTSSLDEVLQMEHSDDQSVDLDYELSDVI